MVVIAGFQGVDEHGKEVSVYASEARVTNKSTLEFSKFTVTSNKIDLDNDTLTFRLYQIKNQVQHLLATHLIPLSQIQNTPYLDTAILDPQRQ